MSHAAPTVGRTAPGQIDSARRPIPFGRLVVVEIRKSFDTRAGRWFGISVLALCLVVVVIYAFAADTADFGDMLAASGGVLGYFLPIIPIMLVTQEWGQRTGLTTFALEPRRSRIVLAKLVASLIIALGVMVVAAIVAVLGTVLNSVLGGDPTWSLTGGEAAGFALQNPLSVLIGFAIGALLLNTAGAIVAYFVWSLVLPVAVQILGALVSWFHDLAPWIDFNTASTALYSGQHVTGEEWGQIATSGLIWIVVPFVLGLVRILRSEVK